MVACIRTCNPEISCCNIPTIESTKTFSSVSDVSDSHADSAFSRKKPEIGILSLGAFFPFIHKLLVKPPAPPLTPPPATPIAPAAVNKPMGGFGSFIFSIASALPAVALNSYLKEKYPYIPEEAKTIPLLATMFGTQLAFWKLGLIQASSVGGLLEQYPSLMIVGLASSFLVDQAAQLFHLDSLQNNGKYHTPVTLLSSVGFYLGLMKTTVGRNFLTASGGGVSGTLGAAARGAAVALMLSAIFRGLLSGGRYLDMAFKGIKPGSYEWRDREFTMAAQKMAHSNSVTEFYRETLGSPFYDYFGGFYDAELALTLLFSDHAGTLEKIDIQKARQKIADDEIAMSDEITEKITLILQNSLDENGKIDWRKAQTQIYQAYSNQESMANIYKTFELTEHFAEEAKQIRLAIEVSGNIQNPDQVLQMAQVQAKTWLELHEKEVGSLNEKRARLAKLGNEIDYHIFVTQDQKYVDTSASLTPENFERYQQEYIPLSQEIVTLEQLEEQSLKMGKLLQAPKQT